MQSIKRQISKSIIELSGGLSLSETKQVSIVEKIVYTLLITSPEDRQAISYSIMSGLPKNLQQNRAHPQLSKLPPEIMLSRMVSAVAKSAVVSAVASTTTSGSNHVLVANKESMVEILSTLPSIVAQVVAAGNGGKRTWVVFYLCVHFVFNLFLCFYVKQIQ